MSVASGVANLRLAKGMIVAGARSEETADAAGEMEGAGAEGKMTEAGKVAELSLSFTPRFKQRALRSAVPHSGSGRAAKVAVWARWR